MTREQARKRAADLVGRMTVEEMASQLRFDAPAIERLGIPACNWWNEALHGLARGGTATSFPQAIGMAAMFDDGLLREIADAISTEARAKYNALSAEGDRDIYHGLTFWSPNINIFRDPRWGRGHETYGEDPCLTARLGAAFVRGLQGEGETLKTAACAKHFAVHSGPEALRHSFNAVASPKDLEETYLPAFRALVQDAGVEAVMGAYNRTNGEPCCASSMLMSKLRGEWGFEGHFVSDCWAIRDFHENHKVTAAPVESVTKALKAGCDLNCGCTYQHIMHAYELGMITEEDISRCAVRLFTTRFLLGTLGGEGSEYDAIPYSVIECPEHLALAHRAALRSCVLLKNDGLLPLDPESDETIGVIGPNANSRSALIGNYHGTASRYVTVLEGIQDLKAGKGRVLYSEGCALCFDRVEPLAQPDDRLAEAVAVAKNSDKVILVLGLDETLEGEEGDTGNSYHSGDKADLLLPPSQRRLLERVLAVGKPTAVVLMVGSAIDVSVAQERACAILLSWYPGAGGGRAVAELLFGRESPSGKLPVTFYTDGELARMPDFTDYSMRNRTYRYFGGTPLYPFGFGLSYGSCSLLSLEADRESASVRVRNESGRELEEVVELYLRDEGSPLAPPNPVLCGFRRLCLKPGEEKAVSVPIDPAAFTVVTEEGKRIPGSGPWRLYAGFCGPDPRSEALSGRKALSLLIPAPGRGPEL
ncbi:MAG: glycoside hydrolase family 3 C-terminal domain-containing protein [Oscillospiraceae bacterium]|nr:glycoside hydrolase family 3 C-terminal domain-containing protein [Oscillospiraceae bacterium]